MTRKKTTRDERNEQNINNGNTVQAVSKVSLTGLDYPSKVKLFMADLIRLNSLRVREDLKKIEFTVTGGSLKILANHCTDNFITGEKNPVKYRFADVELMTVTDDGMQVFTLSGLNFTAEIFQAYKPYNIELFENAKYLEAGYFLKRYGEKAEHQSQYEHYLANVDDATLFV